MRITDVGTVVLGTAWRNLVFVQVKTDEGLTGVGEATLQNGEEAVLAYITAAAQRHVVGSDPHNIEDLCLRMLRDDFWRMGVVGYTGLSAVEVACWDIVGQEAGQPVWRLLGGQCRDKLLAYANGWYQVARTPSEFAAAARRVVAKGYRGLKVDPFGAGTYELDRRELSASIALIEAVRDAVGPDVHILVEGHGRFAPATAIRIARELARFDPDWLEEPVPPDNFAALARVARRSPVPIAAGERAFTRFDYWRLLQSEAVDIIQPDVIHCGGVLELKKIAAMADANYVLVAPHNSNGPVCTAASVHAGFTLTNFKIQEVFDDFVEPFVRDAVVGYPRVVDGYIAPPDKPGLGVSLNLDLIAEHPYRPGHFNLFAEDWQKRQSIRPSEQ